MGTQSIISACLNAGKIISTADGSGIIGRIQSGWVGKIEKSYTCTDVLTAVITMVDSTVGSIEPGYTGTTDTATEFTKESALGETAKTLLTELDFENVWSEVPDDLPMPGSTLLLIEQSKIVPEETPKETTVTTTKIQSTTTTVTTKTEATETSATTETTKKSGCKSNISFASISVASVSLAGIFILIAKRKKSGFEA